MNDRIDFTGDKDENKNSGKSETNLQLHIAEDRKPMRKLNNANGGTQEQGGAGALDEANITPYP